MEKTTISKNQIAEVKTKTGKDYSYKYVDIAQIHEYLENINARYIQQVKRIDTDDYIMTKRCFNNEWEAEWLQGCRVVDATLMGVNNPAQQQGSALTYARRYSLLMAFGLATNDDDAQSLTQQTEYTKEEAEKVVVNFGKHSGKTLKEIKETNENYLHWIIDSDYASESLKSACKTLVEPITQESLDLLGEFETLIIETDTDREKIYEHFKVKSNNELTEAQLKEAIEILKNKKGTN